MQGSTLLSFLRFLLVVGLGTALGAVLNSWVPEFLIRSNLWEGALAARSHPIIWVAVGIFVVWLCWWTAEHLFG